MWQKYVPMLLLKIKMDRFRLGFHVSFVLEDLRRLRKYKGVIMERAALKELMYGAIEEMMKNSKYYYHSSIGASYGHWTDIGKENLQEFLEIISHEVAKARAAEDEKRSRDLVMKELKS
jgi:hypothetical protein